MTIQELQKLSKKKNFQIFFQFITFKALENGFIDHSQKNQAKRERNANFNAVSQNKIQINPFFVINPANYFKMSLVVNDYNYVPYTVIK